MSKILVVDDSPLDRQIAGGLLEKNWNIDVVFAENGVEGLAGVNLHRPDLVFD